MNPQSLLAQLKWRYATKKFDPSRKIDAQTWTALEEALVLTPSSFGLQPWKFFVVHDPALRLKLRAASWNQSQITDASHLVVFAHKKDMDAKEVERFVHNIAQVRGLPPASLEGYKKVMVNFVANPAIDLNQWATYQVYIALGNFMTCAAVLGIDACPMEGLDPKQYDAILGLEEQGYHTVCAATAGFRATDDPYARLAKVRYPHSDVIVEIR